MKTNFKKYLWDGLLIVFSVLFALFINKTFEAGKTRQKKKIALESIIKELNSNQANLELWKNKHVAIRNTISAVIDGQADSIKAELKKYNYLNLGVLTHNESLIDAVLIKTAWQSAQTTGIITEFDYETIQQLTMVYELQEIIMNRTVVEILDFLFDSESHDMENLDRTLVQLQLRFQELTGQEQSMASLYKNVLNKLGE